MSRNPIHAVAMLLRPSPRSRHISCVLGVVQLMYVGCCKEGFPLKTLVVLSVLFISHNTPRESLFLAHLALAFDLLEPLRRIKVFFVARVTFRLQIYGDRHPFFENLFPPLW